MSASLQFAKKTASPGQAIQTLEALRAEWRDVLSVLTQEQIDALLSVFGNSSFFSRWAQLYPHKIKEMFQTPWNKSHSSKEYKKEIQNALPQLRGLEREELSSALIDFKYRHLFRIPLSDVAHIRPFEEIVA